MYGKYVYCKACKWASRTVALGGRKILTGYTCCPGCGGSWWSLTVVTGRWVWKGSTLMPWTWNNWEFELLP